MNNRKIIDEFFVNNYPTLLRMSSEYIRKYEYRLLLHDEIVSELYLFMLLTETRTKKLSELILLSAYTRNYVYNYDNQALFYIAKIIYNVTRNKRAINGSKIKKIPLIYVDTIYDSLKSIEDDDDEIKTADFYKTADVLNAVEQIINETNWYKHRVWWDYHFGNLTYQQLSKKYKLSATPIYYMVKDFNLEIRKQLLKIDNK